jgi:hypothetical protein
MILNYSKSRWKEYTINRIETLATTLGYKTKLRNEITNYQSRKLPKIKIGKYTYYLLTNPTDKIK